MIDKFEIIHNKNEGIRKDYLEKLNSLSILN